jgi:predicted CXXCH cytochrome family protein
MVMENACGNCHDAHASQNSQLLRRRTDELCFNCHEPQMVLDAKTSNLTNFRDGERNLHFVHVNREDKGRSCRTCHDVHGSDLPKHMASSVPFEGSNWSMPIAFEPMTDGGRCAPGCHTPKEYHRQAATLAAPATQMTTTQPTTAPTTRGVS